MDIETREYLDDMRRELAGLIEALGGRLGTLDGRVEGLDGRVELLRADMQRGDAETRDSLGALIEAQRHDLAAVAEGVAANTEAIDRLRTETRARFEAVRLAFVAVRLDIKTLRARR